MVDTGKHTARAAADKFVVREPQTEEHVWWGQYNRPFNPESFSTLHARLQRLPAGARRVRAGLLRRRRSRAPPADPHHHAEGLAQPVRAHHVPEDPQRSTSCKRHVPDFTIIAAPGFQASPLSDGTRTETFIVLNFRQKLALIGGTSYGGEIKKTIFTVLNYLLPLEGVLSMHCSANVGDGGRRGDLLRPLRHRQDHALAPTPARRLIGDDEHGWGDNGVFNFEDGCYAKVIRLSPEAEPQIYRDCTRRFGTILENVVYDPVSRRLDLERRDADREHPRRLSARLHRQRRAREDGAGHPKNVIFLTCDAIGRDAADLAARRPTRRSTTSSPATPARSPAPRSASASSRRSPSAPASAGRSWCTTRTSTPSCCKQEDAAARRQLLAGQHRLDRRAVRRRQAHQHPPHPRSC